MSKFLYSLSVGLSPEDGRVQKWCFDEAQEYTFSVMERQYVCVIHDLIHWALRYFSV